MVTNNFGFVPSFAPRQRAFSNIQPFTYEDGLTYHEILEEMRAYIQVTLVPFIQNGLDNFGQEVIDALNARLSEVEDRIDETEILVAEAQTVRDEVANIQTVIQGIYTDAQAAADQASDAAALAETARSASETARDDAEAARDEIAAAVRVRLTAPADFGAVGDGVADDTAAWNDFQAYEGIKVVPAGNYLVDGEVIHYPHAVLGGGVKTTNLTTGELRMVSTRPDVVTPDGARIFISTADDGPDISPAIYVISLIDDASGDRAATKNAGIHSYMEQTGTDTNQYVKAITGVSVNAASGDNDSTGVVGYSYKLPVDGGVGDAAGGGGAAWQYSTEEGLVLGGEFAAYQNVEGTRSSPNATNGNNTMSLHLTTNSIGDRVWSALGIDGQNAATEGMGRFGYWNAITIARSCFGNDGVSEEGTVGINFGNNTSIYPEKAMYLGNAVYHFWRHNAGTRMRTSSLDIDNGNGAIGVRLFTNETSPQSRYIGGYRGETGPDGETVSRTDGAIVFASNGYVEVRASDDNGDTMSVIALSPNSPAVLPSSDGSMNLGASGRVWDNIYLANSPIETSDERYKTDISDIPNVALDAWGDVCFNQYRMSASVDSKGDSARYHTGVIAQRIVEAFEARGLDAWTYGLMCFDEWDSEESVTEVEKVLKKHAVYEQVKVRDAVYDEQGREVKAARYEDGALVSPEEYEEVEHTTPGIAGGNKYAVRYSEALVFEAAYQRRRADRIEQRLSRLEELAEI